MDRPLNQGALLKELARLDEEIRSRIIWAQLHGRDVVDVDIDVLRRRRHELEDQLDCVPGQMGILPQFTSEALLMMG